MKATLLLFCEVGVNLRGACQVFQNILTMG
jgi:hypothetical protein